jgi:cytochrome c biogenesis protein
MELAIVLLVTLALACVMGSLLPQENVVASDKIQFQFDAFYPYAKAMGFFTVFSSPWFLTVEVLFFFSVLFGSFHWLKPAYRQITQRVFLSLPNIQAFTHHQCDILLPCSTLPQAVQWLESHLGFRFSVKVNSSNQWLLSGQRGWLGRVGPMVVHLGIVVLLAACLCGAFTNFLGQHVMAPGQTFFLTEATVFNTSIPRPWWMGTVPKWQVRIDDFAMQFYPNSPNKVSQYTTTLSILESRTHQPLAQGDFSVNHPFHYDGVSFYQASYQPTGGHFLNINHQKNIKLMATETLVGRPFVKQRINSKLTLWFFPLSRLTDGVQQHQLQVFAEVNGVLRGFGQTVAQAQKASTTLRAGDAPTQFQGVWLQYLRPEIATGVQFKGATEVTAIYCAFALLTLGFLLSQIPHWQLWAVLTVLDNQTVQVAVAYRAKKQLPTLQQRLTTVWKVLATQRNTAEG